MIDTTHREALSILYSRAYQHWYCADPASLLRVVAARGWKGSWRDE